jgi:PAS domain S-box-containing protein
MGNDDQIYKILLVEDLPSDAHLAEYEVAKALSRYLLRVVETKTDFMKALSEFQPDIVVSDYQLPSFDGLSVLRIVLDMSPVTPVIILTGSMNEDTAVDCMKAGAVDYVIKEHIKRLGPAILNAIRQRNLNIQKIESQKRLEESEAKFRYIFHGHSAVKLIIDKTGLISEANESAAIFYGWNKDTLQGMNISNIVVSENDEMNYLQIFSNNHVEQKHIKSDGQIYDVEVFKSRVYIGNEEFYHLIIHDVSDKKSNEQKLRLLSRSTEQSPVSILITDNHGIIEYVNPMFCKSYGYIEEECVGRRPDFLKSGYHPKEFYVKLWNTILKGNDWEQEVYNKTKNGYCKWDKVIISPIINEKGQITHFVEVLEDISEKKKIIEDLTLSKERAEESERVKTAFLQNMSHEIRTPMNGILGFLELITEPRLSDDVRNRYIEIVKNSSNKLLSTFNSILEASKIETGTTVPIITKVNVDDMMNYFYNLYKPQAHSKGIEIHFKNGLNDEHSVISSDKFKLETIITNLMSNSVKFTDTGFVEFGNYIDSGSLVFYFKDTGIGISRDRLDTIFEKFTHSGYYTTRPHEGVGLGLSIVKSYTTSLGGKVEVDSEEGKGSLFTVKIPLNLV